MSKFFNSDVVRQVLEELGEMQMKLFEQTMFLPSLTKQERKEHINLMKEFLEKQKLLYVRMSLSDDPEAIETKERIIASAKLLGLTETQSMDDFFNGLNSTIEKLESSMGF